MRLFRKRITYQEIATIELINKYFWKSKIGPISAIFLPFFLMIIYKIISSGSASQEEGANAIFASALSAYISFSILPLCFMSIPQMLVEFKTSIILRKISNSNISVFKFIILILGYNLIAIFSSLLIIFTLFATFLNIDAPQIFKSIQWGQFIYSIFNVIMCGLTFAVFLGIIINRINLVQIIGFCIIIISITFSGQFIPLNVMYQEPAIGYISLFMPMSYSLNLMTTSLTYVDGETIIKNIARMVQEYVPKEEIGGIELTPEQILEQFVILSPINPEVSGDLAEKFKQMYNYKYNGIFDLKNPFEIISLKSQVINTAPDAPTPDPKLSITKIKFTTVYETWQSGLNLVMPYVLSLAFTIASLKQFKWLSR